MIGLNERTIQEIHILWRGPFSAETVKQKFDNDCDYGIYQVYGSHAAYGGDVLLYIGKAALQTFSKRITQHGTWLPYGKDPENISIYLGRLFAYDPDNGGVAAQPEYDDWNKLIDISERLLIFSHAPAFNSSNISNIKPHGIDDIHLMNWDNYRDLLPEVSAKYWTANYPGDFSLFCENKASGTCTKLGECLKQNRSKICEQPN